jgi:hypothetical protein
MIRYASGFAVTRPKRNGRRVAPPIWLRYRSHDGEAGAAFRCGETAASSAAVDPGFAVTSPKRKTAAESPRRPVISAGDVS